MTLFTSRGHRHRHCSDGAVIVTASIVVVSMVIDMLSPSYFLTPIVMLHLLQCALLNLSLGSGLCWFAGWRGQEESSRKAGDPQKAHAPAKTVRQQAQSCNWSSSFQCECAPQSGSCRGQVARGRKGGDAEASFNNHSWALSCQFGSWQCMNWWRCSGSSDC